VPAGVLRAGVNVIAVRVVDGGGGGGFLPTPSGLQLLPHGESASRQAVPLSGQWRYKTGKPLGELPPFPPRLTQNPNLVTVLSNGMIEPLVPFAIKGAIWYQGESNAARAEQYRKLLPALIADWRRRFRVGEFPFLIVQLANFRARDPQPLDKSEWAELREAQTLTARKVPRCGLALAIDIGEENDIHPANKQDVGKRLALEARRVAFGERVESQGPAFQSMRIEAGKARIKFAHADGGLVVKDGGTAAKGFALAGRDGRWVWASGEVSGEEVIVSSPEVAEPAAVRYAWASNPETNLYN
jgi:sialate O-acetylesterase